MEDDVDIIIKNAGDVLRRYRKEAGLTMEQLSGLIGISKGYYSQIELCDRKPNLKFLIKMGRALNVRPGVILDAIVEEMRNRKG